MVVLEKLTAKPPPWAIDEDGVRRVGGTRVRLDTILIAFQNGAAPEEIVLKYPSLVLADVYSVITYYLWHPLDLDAYLATRAQEGDATRRELELTFPNYGIRNRLLARRKD